MGHLNLASSSNSFNGEFSNGPIKPSRGALACMINSEIGTVLAVMRRNARWGVQYMSDDDQLEHFLIHSLKELRKQIFSWENQWHNIKPAIYLQPFLDVIRSDETGAPITGVALSSVYKILTMDVLNLDTVSVEDAMNLIVETVTSCRFEVTDPASEEVVLMKILQVLLACMKSKAAVKLSNQQVCNIVTTCFRIVHQASSKGELLQRIARHTMHELVRCIFSHLPDFDNSQHLVTNRSMTYGAEAKVQVDGDHNSGTKHIENGNDNAGVESIEGDGVRCGEYASNAPAGSQETELKTDTSKSEAGEMVEAIENSEEEVMLEPFGIPCMVEVFHFLCSLLNAMDQIGGPRSNQIAYDEDVPLFALGLINSAIELGGYAFSRHPKLLGLVQDELFRNLTHFGLSMSPLILSTVYSVVLNLYHHLRTDLKVQLEAFFSCVLLRLAQSKHGSSYQQQEVALEAVVDFCRQPTFMAEMYANYDCDITSTNVFEDLANLLSKSAFPVNGPLSAMQTLALDGLVSMVQGLTDRIGNDLPDFDEIPLNCESYEPFWMLRCENYSDIKCWVQFVHKTKYVKKRLIVGADHFNRDPKKGLEFLQGMHLLPDKLDPQSVASFFRYTSGLDKNHIGDFLGNHDDFCVQVLHEFANTFDFTDMKLDTALRLFLGTFRLPGEAQKIQRVLEAFSERYYEQSPQILSDKDAALLLSYSIILLNTDQHNVQVKKKMTEQDFIRNNRLINGGKDLPREYLLELYHSICENEIQMIPDEGASSHSMSSSRWLNVLHKSRDTPPYILCDSTALLDCDMFAILAGPSIAAISVVFDQVGYETILQTCIDGYLAIAKISANYHFDDVLYDLIGSLCKFTTLLTPLSVEDADITFQEDSKARMATTAVFTVANKYGDYIRSGWKNVLDCVLSLHKLGLLPAHMANDAAEDMEPSSELEQVKPSAVVITPPVSVATPRKSSGLIGRFSQLLSFDMEETRLHPTDEQVIAHQRTLEIIKNCHIDSVFRESKFLHAESLLQLVRALISASGQFRKGSGPVEDGDTAVFCLELLIVITLNNRDRIMLIWKEVYEHISNIVQSSTMPGSVVEKAVFGLLRICQRLLPYKENLTDELLKSLQLVLKLDARVADAYCEPITQEVARLVKSNVTHIRSHAGWRTIISLLFITARHPEASETGFEALVFIMSEGAHLLPSNYILCVDAARQFAESRVGEINRSLSAIDMMAGSIVCLVKWSRESKNAMVEEEAVKVGQDIGEMWLRLVQGLKRVCLDQREEVRNHAILMLQTILGVDGIQLQNAFWFQCFDSVIFTLLDDLLEIAQGNYRKEYRNMERTLVLATKLMSKAFLQSLEELSQQPSFCKLWLGVLNRMEKYMKVKFRGRHSEKVHELIPELLKNILFVMKTTNILLPRDDIGGDSFWQLTWLQVNNLCPSLQSEVFPQQELGAMQPKHIKAGGGIAVADGAVDIRSSETTA